MNHNDDAKKSPGQISAFFLFPQFLNNQVRDDGVEKKRVLDGVTVVEVIHLNHRGRGQLAVVDL